MTKDTVRPYKVVIRGPMPTMAHIWLRNNRVDHDILYQFDYNEEELIVGERLEIFFADEQQAHWFALRWSR